MKNLLLLMTVILITVGVMAQTPERMSYQAVVRNSENQLLISKTIGVRISILEGSVEGTSVYTETLTTSTNNNGLISIEIGEDENFSTINWGDGIYFLQTEIDPEGGSNYTITATQQMLSVPYALHSKTAEILTQPIDETDPLFTVWDKSTGIIITENQISDLQSYLTTEIDPTFAAWDKTTGIVITENQISDLQNYITTELDPLYALSIASGITANDTANWNTKLSQEFDPQFNAWDKTSGITITESQISDLQNYLITEIDPAFIAWDKTTGIVITESQISDLQNYITTELDPIYSSSIAAGITANDTSNWNSKLAQELDPQFNAWDKTTGIVITENQISDLQDYITVETDPVYTTSIAAGIDENDIINWNSKLSNEVQTLSHVAALNNSVNTQIKNMQNPTDPQDAATKAYVDALIAAFNETIAALEDRIELLENHLPAVNTANVTQISGTAAFCGGDIISDGGSIILGCGVCWSTTENPTINDAHTSDTYQSNSFVSHITGLTINTNYFVRAYVINSNGINYGEQKMFITNSIINGEGVTDLDGNYYSSVIIGNQEWMAENLKTTKYNDGSVIPYVPNGEEWVIINSPAYCWHSNDISNKDMYGALYNWYAVNTRKLCPTGWHVPSDNELTTLRNFVGSPEGTKLKSTSGWLDGGNGIDLLGFTALPAGFRYWNNEDYYAIGYKIYLWSASESDNNNAWEQGIYHDSNYLHRNARNKHYGFSVRCVKD
ncbi:MAG: FISUMP domain-containing protein [Bacteroidales bacterium]|nr:FISUMP domain-containing protein [Bacteroidales bacterium]